MTKVITVELYKRFVFSKVLHPSKFFTIPAQSGEYDTQYGPVVIKIGRENSSLLEITGFVFKRRTHLAFIHEYDMTSLLLPDHTWLVIWRHDKETCQDHTKCIRERIAEAALLGPIDLYRGRAVI
jgi:hypothetical protein